MKIHAIRLDCGRAESEEEDAKWHFRLRAEVRAKGKPKLMQTAYIVPDKIFREQIVKAFQKMGMDLSQLSILDEGAI